VLNFKKKEIPKQKREILVFQEILSLLGKACVDTFVKLFANKC
jgi:hypothetical protein